MKISPIVLGFSLFFQLPVAASQYLQGGRDPVRDYRGQTIWDIAKMPEDQVDVGLWALIVAQEFDNSVDIHKYLDLLDSYTREIKRMLAGRTSDFDKFAATRMFIYGEGVWNGYSRFEYDLIDPLGSNPFNQLLSSYLDSRKGNCVSMPTLFYALMKRLDPTVDVSIVRAPMHLFCRIKDRQTGDVWNFEATSGTIARNIWYIEQLNIPRQAIESGIYMKELSKRQFIGALVQVLVSKYRETNDLHTAMKYTDLALELNPNEISALVSKCALNAEHAHFLQEKKEREGGLSESDSKRLIECIALSKDYLEKVRSLGWRPETAEEQGQYLQTAKQEKQRREQE